MNNFTDDYIKMSKWTDDMKKDTKYFGVGSVNNNTHLANGRSLDKPNEDRYFNYEFKENSVYAYGLLDGYSGPEAVDLADQYLLTNMYFDHLENLEKKTDEEIFEILENEFEKTENILYGSYLDVNAKIAQLNIDLADLPRNDKECKRLQRKLKELNQQLNSGLFGLVALIVNDRLFIANVGQINCFVCFLDKNETNNLKLVSLQTDHTISNLQEVSRLAYLKADIKDLNSLVDDENIQQYIKYTRFLGDFQSKKNFKEYDVFKTCTSSPIIALPDHPSKSLLIDDSYLFMVIYSDAVGEAIKATYSENKKIEISLTEMLIEKIISEQTLNSASQSVLDSIKRDFDDKFTSSFNERGDFTLLIRSFDTNLKTRLDSLSNQNLVRNGFSIHDSIDESMIGTNVSDERSQDSLEHKEVFTDKDVTPYLNLDKLNELIINDEELSKFAKELKLMTGEKEDETIMI